MSTTNVETWAGADLSTLGPIYPFVGTETILLIVGVIFWLAFHFIQAGQEKRELEADEKAARSPDRLKRRFAREREGD